MSSASQYAGSRGQQLGRKVSSINVEKIQHRGRTFSRDAARKARPGPSASTDLPQRKETDPFFFCLFVFLIRIGLRLTGVDNALGIRSETSVGRRSVWK